MFKIHIPKAMDKTRKKLEQWMTERLLATYWIGDRRSERPDKVEIEDLKKEISKRRGYKIRTTKDRKTIWNTWNAKHNYWRWRLVKRQMIADGTYTKEAFKREMYGNKPIPTVYPDSD